MYEMMSKAAQRDRERTYRAWDEQQLCALPDGITIARKRFSLAKWAGWLLALVPGK